MPTNDAHTIDALDLGAGTPEAFLVVYVDGTSRVVPLPDGVEVSIGRSRACTIFVDDERISRRHAALVRRGPDVFVRDLGSRNGTRVGGERIAGEIRVHGGDVVTVGPVRAVVAIAIASPGHIVPASDLAETALGPDDARTGPPGTPADLASTDDGRDPDADAPHVVADSAMAKVYDLVRKVAASPLSVLVTGETGVGKERVAEAVHLASPRANRPLIRLHVASLPETLVESELFGHEKGAFTGADRRRIGYFETASGGTLFLDEIGELPAATQAKLLRVLETRRIVRIGSTDEIEVDVRVVAATHRDLADEVRAGRFREDLFFRLAAFTIAVPPLRARPGEIPVLAAMFARDMARGLGRPTPAITPRALAALGAYAWPGNVRQLKNVIEGAVVMADPGEVDLRHLPADVADGADAGSRATASGTPRPAAPGASPHATEGRQALAGVVDRVEHDAIVAALKAADGNQTRAAAQLGISRRGLIYKMRKHGIKSVRTVE